MIMAEARYMGAASAFYCVCLLLCVIDFIEISDSA